MVTNKYNGIGNEKTNGNSSNRLFCSSSTAAQVMPKTVPSNIDDKVIEIAS